MKLCSLVLVSDEGKIIPGPAGASILPMEETARKIRESGKFEKQAVSHIVLLSNFGRQRHFDLGAFARAKAADAAAKKAADAAAKKG